MYSSPKRVRTLVIDKKQTTVYITFFLGSSDNVRTIVVNIYDIELVPSFHQPDGIYVTKVHVLNF